jgi:hypothetical protein
MNPRQATILLDYLQRADQAGIAMRMSEAQLLIPMLAQVQNVANGMATCEFKAKEAPPMPDTAAGA